MITGRLHSDRPEKKTKRKREKSNNGALAHITTLEDTSASTKEKIPRQINMSSTSSDSAVPHYTLSVSSTTTLSAMEAKAFLEGNSVMLHIPQGVPTVTPVIKFSQLDVPPQIQSAFAGFKEPTPIQACTWPPALDGRDVVGIAETGRSVSLAGCF